MMAGPIAGPFVGKENRGPTIGFVKACFVQADLEEVDYIVEGE